MRTFCGLAGYRTLPNKYKKESNNNEKQKQSKEQPQQKRSLFSLPPRPRVSRSFSLSEPETKQRVSRSFSFSEPRQESKQETRQSQQRLDTGSLGRTQSVYGLQSGPGLSWIDSLTSSDRRSSSAGCPPEEIPRSHSLLSLQSHKRRGSGPQPSHHSSNGQLTPAPGDGGQGGQATASIWSRARSESFRNLRDLADRDKSGSAWSLFNKTLSPLLTRVEPPKVPARTKKLKASGISSNKQEIEVNPNFQPPTSETADTWRASSVSLNRMSSLSGHQPLMTPGDPMPGHQRLMTPDWRTGGPPSHRRLSSFSSPSSLPASAPASPSMSRHGHHARGGLGGSQSSRVKHDLHQTSAGRDSVTSWLSALGYAHYSPLLTGAGYDLPTLARATPEDLTGAGVTQPRDRQRLLAALAGLQTVLGDGLPDHVPDSLQEWLGLIRLDSYYPSLEAQGYTTIDQMLRISVEDLEDIGFYKLGHQKRLMLAIRKVKDLLEESDRKRGQRGARRSLGSFTHPPPPLDTQDDTPVSMPAPMEPLHNPLYMNSLVPYLESLALPKNEDTVSLKTKSFPNSFQNLPPKSRPVAKVPANARVRRSSVGTYSESDAESDHFNSNFAENTKNSDSDCIMTPHCNKSNNYFEDIRKQPLGPDKLFKSFDSPRKPLDVTFTNIPITKVSQQEEAKYPAYNGHPRSDYATDSGYKITNGHKFTDVEMTRSHNIVDPRQGERNTRARTRSTGDVLEDIDWMLSDLTCELDKMLQLESEETRDQLQ